MKNLLRKFPYRASFVFLTMGQLIIWTIILWYGTHKNGSIDLFESLIICLNKDFMKIITLSLVFGSIGTVLVGWIIVRMKSKGF
ncbi:MAG: hypothetical protein VXV96_11575 [Bdellovibrionota bacterium]|nr:hypothetical protein [Bdellovibrionota bacterium]